MEAWNPRDYTQDRHRTVDDRPYGGGPGMVMKPEPVIKALTQAKSGLSPGNIKTIYMSPQGRPIKQAMLREAFESLDGLVILCGRYEGIDERIIESEVDEEWSLGDFILSGGEIAAAAVIDGICRLVPGVLGHSQSAENDSFENGWLDFPHYTRPEEYQSKRVPEVLLSGDHQKIRVWRLEQAIRRTLERRPDLVNECELSEEELRLVHKIKQDLSN